MYKLASFKEKTLLELKNLKTTIELTKKTFDQQIEFEDKNLKDLIKKTIEQNNLKFESEIETFTQRVNDVKLENAKYHLGVIKQSQELKDDMVEIIEFKTNYKEKYSLKANEFKIQKTEIENIKKELKNFKECSQNVKDSLTTINKTLKENSLRMAKLSKESKTDVVSNYLIF